MTILEEAIRKIEIGKTAEGLKTLKQLKKNTNDEMLLFSIAQIYANYGFLHEALDTVQTLLNNYPEEGELILFSAECLIELGNDLEALELLHAIDQESDYYLRGLLLLADLYQAQGLEEVAENKLLEANNMNPREPIIWYALAEFYLTQGNYYKAGLYYEKLLNDNNFTADETVYLHFAETLSMLGQFEKAIPYFQKGLQSETNLDGLFRFGYTAYKAGHYNTTIEVLTKLQSLDPQYSTLYPLLANAYTEIGNTKKAIDTLKRGLEHDEQNEEIYFLLSKLLMNTDKKHEAEQYLKESFALNSPSIKATQLYIDYLKEEGRYDDVIKHIHKLKERHEDTDPMLDWELAEAYEQIENFEKANDYFKASYPFLKDNSEFLERYGFFLLEEGKVQEAKTCFKKAITIDNNLFHLEELIDELENRLI
ncbi:tetratricopeptide repeat protein [Pueribacillus sp. YX66]|uniref:tetratricopeptide repeat protein n=1 Tax=Pueribacillus sp. YX66 TaxID=3229242 RepID=UPI00358D7F51